MQYIRICPTCKNEVYHTNKNSAKHADRKKRLCLSCAANFKSQNSIGSKNPFFGKKHSDEFKQKLSKERTGVKLTGKRLETVKTNLKLASKIAQTKSFYEWWVEKYGKEEADKKMDAHRQRVSENTAGSKNPMYGKPSPRGSGNGWKGWYKKIFFRSLREVMFIITFLEPSNKFWETGEKAKFAIKYKDYFHHERNYYPDFIVEGRDVYECKPRRLWDTPLILLKTKAAMKFCEENKMSYHLIDNQIDAKIILDKLNSGDLIFLNDIYKEKFINYVNAHSGDSK